MSFERLPMCDQDEEISKNVEKKQMSHIRVDIKSHRSKPMNLAIIITDKCNFIVTTSVNFVYLELL